MPATFSLGLAFESRSLEVPFSSGRSHRVDSAGERDERHANIAYSFNALRMYRLWRRMVCGNFAADPQSLEAGFPFRRVEIFGIDFRANPTITFGYRKIQTTAGIRNGQRAAYFAFSL